MDLRKVFDCMISVSELGRGQASKVIQSVEDGGNPYIVVKNNKPQAVIISISDYTELMRAKDLFSTMQQVQTPYYNMANMNPNNFTPNNFVPNNFVPNSFPPNSFPPNNFPTNNFPTNNLHPNNFPPVPPQQDPDHHNELPHSPSKSGTLTKDEISIFLQDEEND